MRKTSRWAQFVALIFAQLSGRQSLRDIESNLQAQRHYSYHLGCTPIARSSLARLNEQQPASCYEALFYRLYQRCVGLAPKHGFRFKNPLYALDASLELLSNVVYGESSGHLFLISIMFNAVNEFDAFNDIC